MTLLQNLQNVDGWDRESTPLPRDALEGAARSKEGFQSGCQNGYRRLGKRLGGHCWWVQIGWRAVAGGQNRLAGPTLTPKEVGCPSASSALMALMVARRTAVEWRVDDEGCGEHARSESNADVAT